MRSTKARAKAPRTAADQASPKYPMSFDVFGEADYMIGQLRRSYDSPCYANCIRLERYRVTVEKVEEPIEVLRARLIEMWRHDEKNHHHWSAFRAEANKLGLNFDVDLGISNQGIDRRSGGG